MMKRSAGEPKETFSSDSRRGSTCPCGLTIGRWATDRYNSMAHFFWAGSGSKYRSSGKYHFEAMFASKEIGTHPMDESSQNPQGNVSLFCHTNRSASTLSRTAFEISKALAPLPYDSRPVRDSSKNSPDDSL